MASRWGFPLRDCPGIALAAAEGTVIHSMFILETAISRWIRIIGIGIDIFGVLVIVVGVLWSTLMYISPLHAGQRYEEYKVRIGRTLLLGLEVLVATDIVKTVASGAPGRTAVSDKIQGVAS